MTIALFFDFDRDFPNALVKCAGLIDNALSGFVIPQNLDQGIRWGGLNGWPRTKRAGFVQPLYKSASDRWRGYEHHLTQERTRLSHWITAYGYDT